MKEAFERPLLPAGAIVRDLRAEIPFYSPEEDRVVLPEGQHPYLEAFINTVFDVTQLGADVVEGLSTPANVALIGGLAVAPSFGIPALATRLGMGALSGTMALDTAEQIGEAYRLYLEETDNGQHPERALASRRLGKALSNATVTGAFAIMAGRGAAHPDVARLGLKAGWKEFYSREGMAEVRAEQAAELQVQRGKKPPPEFIPREFIQAMEAESRAKAAKPAPIVSGPPLPPTPPTQAAATTPPPSAEVLRRESDRLQAEIQRARGPEREQVERRIAENREMLSELERKAGPPTRGAGEEALARATQESEAAMEQARIESQRGVLRIQKGLPNEITVVPRPSDLLPLLQFLRAPSQQFGKVHPSAGKIVERTIEASENIAHSTKVALEEVHTAWRHLKPAEQKAVIHLLDDAGVTPENLSVRTPPRIRESYIKTRVLLDEQRARINEARAKAGKPPITGIVAGYWPHVFGGDWAITKQVGKRWQPLETGWLAESQIEAIQKARDYLKSHPRTRLKVELKRLHLTPEEATVLPRGEYFRLVNRLSKLTATEIDPVTGEIRIGPAGRKVAFDELRGVARPGGRKPGKARFGHAEQRRTDLSGWMEDVKALDLLVRGAERYIQMLPLRADVAKLREQVRKEAPDAKRLHAQLDSYIDAAVEGKPDAFTRSFNDAWQMIGERFGVVARPAALQRISRRVNEAQSLLKLGFSPATAVVNLSQTALNTYPILGAKWTARGMRLYVQAARDNLLGRQNRYWDVIKELGIPEQLSKAEDVGFRDYVRGRFPRSGAEVGEATWRLLTDTALWMFRSAEQANRSVAALGKYAEMREGKGRPHAEAIQEARNVITKTQFVYGPTDAPAVLRQAWTRTPGQFKTFWIRELDFVLSLRGKEIPRFLAAMTLVSGAVGIPGVGLLNEVTKLVSRQFGEEYDFLEEAELEARAGGALRRGLTMGVPAALGVDMLRNIGFTEFLVPSMQDIRGLLGPTGSDISNFIRWTQAPRGREKDQAFRRMMTGLSPTARRLSSILTQKGKLIDPRTKQVVAENVSQAEAIGVAMGFTPMRIAQDQALDWAIRREIVRDASLRGGVADRIAELRRLQEEADEAGDDDAFEQYAAEEERWMEIAESEGVDRKLLDHVRRRIKELRTPRIERTLERAPRRLEEKLERYEQLRLGPPPPPQ